MSIFPQSSIRIIAGEVSIGNTCYINRRNSKITIIDQSIEDSEMILAQNNLQAKIERKIDDYVKVNPLAIEDNLVMMRDFLEEVPNKSDRKQLLNALKRSNPVRNFTTSIESDMELSLLWEFYITKEQLRWVSNVIIDAYNY